jgi:Ca2+-binding RTX toxin-like protein
VWGLSLIKRKGKGLVRRTILLLGAMLVALVVVGGVAFALTCTGGTCQGTDSAEDIYGSDTRDTIDGYGGDDYINGRGGSDYIDGGDGNDTIEGDGGVVSRSLDTLVGGEGTEDYCYGDLGYDKFDISCEYQYQENT